MRRMKCISQENAKNTRIDYVNLNEQERKGEKRRLRKIRKRQHYA